MEEQASLAATLAQMGVDVIQTEGSPFISTMSTGHQAAIEKAAPALSSTYVLSRTVTSKSKGSGKNTYVMASSGINEVTAPMALVCGARGVGVGSAITKCASEAEMATKVRAIACAISLNKVNRA